MNAAPPPAGAATIREATTATDMALARALFVEYARWLKVDLCFQGFDEELRTLPGAYAPPRGRLLLAGRDADAFACIALRPLAQPAVGEIKRLYVQPAQRGEGWGRRLVAALLAEARAIGYDELKLDTLDWMNAARALYEETGFRRLRAVLRQSASRRRLHVAAAARRRRPLTPHTMAHRAFLDQGESAALEQAIAALEAQTGVQLVTAVIGKADSYVELPWKAFALGAALAGLVLVGRRRAVAALERCRERADLRGCDPGRGCCQRAACRRRTALRAAVPAPEPPRPRSSSVCAGVFPAPRIVRHAAGARAFCCW